MLEVGVDDCMDMSDGMIPGRVCELYCECVSVCGADFKNNRACYACDCVFLGDPMRAVVVTWGINR